jgi:hypothetical protein
MYQRPGAPSTIGGIIDDSIRLYKATIRTWWLPSLLLSALSIAVTILMFLRLGATPSPADMLKLLRLPIVWAVYPLMMVLSVWMYMVMIANMTATVGGEQLSLAGGFARGLRSLPAALAATILFFLCFVVGTVLLIVPGIYAFGRLQYWPAALFAEDAGPVQALGSSWRLVKGNWWRAMTIFSVLLIMVIVLSMVITFVAGITVAVAHLDAASALIGVQALSNVANILIVPVFPAALVATYGDLKLRRDGGDLEARVQDLKPA